MGEFFRVREYAAKWGICPETVRRWIKQGKLKGCKKLPGGHWRVPADADPSLAPHESAQRLQEKEEGDQAHVSAALKKLKQKRRSR